MYIKIRDIYIKYVKYCDCYNDDYTDITKFIEKLQYFGISHESNIYNITYKQLFKISIDKMHIWHKGMSITKEDLITKYNEIIETNETKTLENTDHITSDDYYYDLFFKEMNIIRTVNELIKKDVKDVTVINKQNLNLADCNLEIGTDKDFNDIVHNCETDPNYLKNKDKNKHKYTKDKRKPKPKEQKIV